MITVVLVPMMVMPVMIAMPVMAMTLTTTPDHGDDDGEINL